MKIKEPCIITSRLMAGIKIGDGTISIDYAGSTVDGRTIYRYYIDLPDYSFEDIDLKSGCGGGSLQGGLESLLFFLSAAAEACNYPDSENKDLFPAQITEWAYNYSNEISYALCSLEEWGPVILEG